MHPIHLLIAILLALSAYANAKNNTTILDTIFSNPDYSDFAKLLNETKGLKPIYDDPNRHVTVFVPNNRAMRRHAHTLATTTPHDAEALLAYHTLLYQVPTYKSLLHTHLLVSTLKLSSLLGGAQKISVQNVHHHVFLNHKAYVLPNKVERVANGAVFELNQVLELPKSSYSVLKEHSPTYSTASLLFSAKKNFTKLTSTLFAPTNTAFSKLPCRTKLYLAQNPCRMTELLKYHLSPAIVYQDILRDQREMKLETMLKGETLSIHVNHHGDDIFINKHSRVVQPDLVSANGVIHGVDKVLMPEVLEMAVKKWAKSEENKHLVSHVCGKKK